MAPNRTDELPGRHGWRINLLAMAIVLATILIGYGLAHPREIALPFGVDAKIVATRGAGDGTAAAASATTRRSVRDAADAPARR